MNPVLLTDVRAICAKRIICARRIGLDDVEGYYQIKNYAPQRERGYYLRKEYASKREWGYY